MHRIESDDYRRLQSAHLQLRAGDELGWQCRNGRSPGLHHLLRPRLRRSVGSRQIRLQLFWPSDRSLGPADLTGIEGDLLLRADGRDRNAEARWPRALELRLLPGIRR